MQFCSLCNPNQRQTHYNIYMDECVCANHVKWCTFLCALNLRQANIRELCMARGKTYTLTPFASCSSENSTRKKFSREQQQQQQQKKEPFHLMVYCCLLMFYSFSFCCFVLSFFRNSDIETCILDHMRQMNLLFGMAKPGKQCLCMRACECIRFFLLFLLFFIRYMCVCVGVFFFCFVCVISKHNTHRVSHDIRT